MGGFTDQELKGMAEIRGQLSEWLAKADYDTDFNLVRWLREHKFDMVKVVRRLRRHLQQRVALGLNRLPTDEQRDRKFLMYYAGSKPMSTEMEGDRLIWNYVCHGKVDVNGLRKAIMPTRLSTELLFECEAVFQQILAKEAETGEQWGQLSVFDFQDFTLDASLISGAVKEMFEFLKAHYPGLVKKVVAVNAPSVAKVVVKMLKPIAPKETEILVLSKPVDLRQHISPAVLPKAFGGDLVQDGDPACPNIIRVPVSKEVPKAERFDASTDYPGLDALTLEPLTLPAGKVKWLTVHVTQPGAVLQWFIQFKNKDDYSIGFYLAEGADTEDTEALVRVGLQSPHYNVTKFPEFGELTAHVAGHYKIRLSNETSTVTKSQCHYMFRIKQDG